MGRLFSKNYEAVKVDESILDRIQNNQPKSVPIRVKPDPNNSSLQGSKELIKHLNNTADSALFDLINTSDISTFEIWYENGQITFYYFIKDKDTRERFLKQLGAHFPDSDVKVVADRFPQIETNEWISGVRFHLRKHYFSPIKHPGGTKGMESDPYRSITSDMAAKQNTKVMVQIAIRPVTKEWTSSFGKDVRKYGEKLREDDEISVLKGFSIEKEPVSTPGHIRQAGKDIIEQQGKKGFYVNVRFITIGPDKQSAIKQAKSLGQIYEDIHEEVTRQSLVPQPQKRNQIPELLNDLLLRRGKNMSIPSNPVSSISTRFNRFINGTCETIIMTLPELVALAHIPDKSINNNKIAWNRGSISGEIPADAPTFEDYHGEKPVKGKQGVDEVLREKEGEGEFESEWNKAGEMFGEKSESEDAIEDSMDDPMEEFVE